MKRKQYIVDKKFQLKTTFSVVGVSFVIIGLIIAAVAFTASYNNKKLATVVGTQDDIVQALITNAQTQAQTKPGDQQIEIRAIASDHNKNIASIKKIIEYNNILLWAVVLAIMLQGVFLYFILILKTHRIAGPIYVMTYYMKQITGGNYPERIRPLRKKDDLHEFYDVFTEMVDALKKNK